MARKATFQLDLRGGADVLQNMAMEQVRRSTKAIESRANGLSNVKFASSVSVGINKRGQRAIGIVSANTKNPYAVSLLKKSIDAGRV